MRRISLLLSVCLFILISGCAAMQHQRAGDKFLQAKNYEMAVAEYEQALDLDPKLSQDTEFMASLNKAKTEHFHETGMELMQQGSWDEAIEEFKKATKVDPNHSLTRIHLTDARLQSSKAHHKKGLEYADRGRLVKAIEELSKSVELNPDNTPAKEALQIATKAKREKDKKAEQHYQLGLTYFNKKDWAKAVDEYNKCLKLNPNHVLARTNISKAKDQVAAAQDEYLKGIKHFEQKDWDQAILQFKSVLSINPHHQQAPKKIDYARRMKAKAESTHQKAQTYFAQHNWDMAISEYKKALDLNPNHDLAKEMLGKALGQGARKHCATGQHCIKSRDWFRASKEFELALEYVPDFSPAKQGLAEVCYQKGLEFEKRNMFGNAVIEFKKAFQMVDDYKGCGKIISATENQIRKRIRYRVALLPFKNSTRDMAAADVISEGLLKELMEGRMENIEVIERAYLARILEEQKLSMTGLIDQQTIIRAGKIRGVDAIITGNVLDCALYADKTVEPRSKKYQSATRSEYNPEYDEARRDYEDAMRNYERAQEEKKEWERKKREAERAKREAEERARQTTGGLDGLRAKMDNVWSSYNTFSVSTQGANVGIRLSAAEMALNAAERKLSDTPMYIDVPVYDHWNYNIYHCEKRATVKVSSRVLDTLTGRVLFTETISKEAVEKDDYIDNPNPSAGIYSDPLELASDAEVKDRVLNTAISELSEIICSSLGEYGIRYYTFAERAVNQGQVEKAIEEYVNFVYSSPKKAATELTKTKQFIQRYKKYDWEELGVETEIEPGRLDKREPFSPSEEKTLPRRSWPSDKFI